MIVERPLQSTRMKGRKKSHSASTVFMLDSRTDYVHRPVMASVANLLMPGGKENTYFLSFSIYYFSLEQQTNRPLPRRKTDEVEGKEEKEK